MAKFETSQYSKLYDSMEGRSIMTAILSNPDLLRANHMFWSEKFRVDPNITPTDAHGKATFTSYMRQLESGQMMDMRAPLGDSRPVERGNAAFYTGVIPDFIAPGYVEKAPERMYKEKLYEQFGDAKLLAMFATDVLQPMVDSANQTLSNMAAQLMSKGSITYNYGGGIHDNLYKADIPAANFKTAGAVSWADTTNCKILDQVRKLYQDILDQLGLESLPMQLEITRNNWNNYWLKNAQVIEWVRYIKSVNNVLLPTTITLTSDMAQEAVNAFEGLPKIVIIEEKQKDETSGIVHGWADNIAVIRPIGYAGYIRHTSILDEEVYTKYGNNLVTRNFSHTGSGLFTVMNSVIANSNLKEWHTDLMMSAIPSLDEFLYHFIINTTTAD
jgi:hypothetical protein